MPYDKGDFTQQGIDGKVAGGLLLNNKRDVDILVSSDEDDSTLAGVAVTIEDHLNDLKYAFFGTDLEAGEVYEIGAGGGGSPVRVCKANITNESTTDDLYVDYSADGITLGSHLMGPEGSTGTLMPYVPTANAMNSAGDYKTIGLIAEKNGGTGVIYFINSGWNTKVGDDWIWHTGLFCTSKSDTNMSIEIVSNVTEVDTDEYSYDYVLTDDTIDGEINMTISGS